MEVDNRKERDLSTPGSNMLLSVKHAQNLSAFPNFQEFSKHVASMRDFRLAHGQIQKDTQGGSGKHLKLLPHLPTAEIAFMLRNSLN